ncbi:cobalamin-binding protein [Halioxenophilus aromaticivorans]|uniref:Cobalamin-binding protein n=1 Tax=Halioxenophilus aromaticivorans TaxID=1306992 RepID=A0AAV3TZQ0_9ALTE
MNALKYRVLLICLCLACAWCVQPANAASKSSSRFSVTDDLGRIVTLGQPAKRVVSLAPHLTENVFAIGAGGTLVGVSQYSDYPAAAQKITQVGDYQSINVEQVIALQPDVILAWVDGGNQQALNHLAGMGIPIYWSRPATIPAIAKELSRLGVLTGHQKQAAQVVDDFNHRLQTLQNSAHNSPVSVFYQVWAKPLQTLNNNSLIGAVITLCGGRNVFGDAPAVVAQVDREAVLLANPEVILGTHAQGEAPTWKADWLPWRTITAVAKQHIYSIEADVLSRHTPRVLQGAQQVCNYLSEAD